jgi:ribosomal protein S18 acetylase RimI-like enzyme
VEFVPLTTDDERDACARIMAGSDPWVTLGIGVDRARAVFDLPDREVLLAKDGPEVAGFAVISMQGVLSGYLQTLAVSPAHRGRGLGAALLARVETRVFGEKPNVFLFVSSFNRGARRFYEAHGYELIGEVPDFLVAGHGELLMRKTTGPLYPSAR